MPYRSFISQRALFLPWRAEWDMSDIRRRRGVAFANGRNTAPNIWTIDEPVVCVQSALTAGS